METERPELATKLCLAATLVFHKIRYTIAMDFTETGLMLRVFVAHRSNQVTVTF
jgi:hypothetical protein